MDKSSLRQLYLKKRKELRPEELGIMSLAIAANFSGLNFDHIKYVHLFYPIAGKLEFNSILIADWIRSIHPEIKLVLSKSDFKKHTLSHFVWEAGTRLKVNEWGITEPETGIQVSPDLLDMVLVPLLAFDKKGNRIGYGKGFYDRFLSERRADVIKVGVSFFPPVEMIEDINENDIALDICITPEKIWKF